MPHPHLASAGPSVLVVVDVQEPFAQAMPDRAGPAKQTTTLVRVPHALGLPVLVTERYPHNLGPPPPHIR